jgi:hypothetical protein
MINNLRRRLVLCVSLIIALPLLGAAGERAGATLDRLAPSLEGAPVGGGRV